MEGDELPVPGHVDVGLEVRVAERDGVAEGGQGVLQAEVGGVERAPPVGEGVLIVSGMLVGASGRSSRS